jgi:hypothetical protein
MLRADQRCNLKLMKAAAILIRLDEESKFGHLVKPG